MQKYTNVFKDKVLERMYHDKQQLKSLIPTFILISLLVVILILTILIDSVVSEYSVDIPVLVTLLIYIVVQLILVLYKLKLIGIAFVMVNHILLYFQITLSQTSSSQQAYLLGQNIMVLQAILLFATDFRQAYLTNISLSIARFLIAELNEPISRYQIVLQILVTLFTMICQFKKDQSMRLLFLLTLKDSKWEQIIPTVATNHFVIFTLNEEQVKFELQYSNFIPKDTSDGLQLFLRSHMINKETLEQHTFKRVRNHLLPNSITTANQESIIITDNNGCKKILQYQQFNDTAITVIISVQTNYNHLIKEYYSNVNKCHVQTFCKFLKQTIYSIQSRMPAQHILYSFHECYAFLCLSINQFKLKKVNLSTIIKYALRHHKNIVVTFNTKGNIQVYSDSNLLLYVLLSFIHEVDQQSLLKITITRNDQLMNIELVGIIQHEEFYKSQQFVRILKLLSIDLELRLPDHQLRYQYPSICILTIPTMEMHQFTTLNWHIQGLEQ